MDFEGKKFGRGPRELGGALDLINQYKLWPHLEFFCKRSLPPSISETPYLHNVVGDTVIRKGEGMELDQLFQNTYLSERNARIHPFDLDILREAFQMRETTLTDLHSAGKGIPTAVAKSKSESKDKERKHRKYRDKDKDHKKHKYHDDDRSNDKDRNRIGHRDSDMENLKKQQDKKRKRRMRHDGSEDLLDIQRHHKMIQMSKLMLTG